MKLPRRNSKKSFSVFPVLRGLHHKVQHNLGRFKVYMVVISPNTFSLILVPSSGAFCCVESFFHISEIACEGFEKVALQCFANSQKFVEMDVDYITRFSTIH